jgi:hypothetical protein
MRIIELAAEKFLDHKRAHQKRRMASGRDFGWVFCTHSIPEGQMGNHRYRGFNPRFDTLLTTRKRPLEF